VLNAEIQFFSNARLKVDTCMDYTRPSLAHAFESITKSVLDAKGRDVKLRYITEITPENISYCKELMKIAHVSPMSTCIRMKGKKCSRVWG